MTSAIYAPSELGQPIPAFTEHAVSVNLPTWAANIGYEEGEEWVISKMKNGYPRFFINLKIRKLMDLFEHTYGRENESCILMPSYAIACRCRSFIKEKSTLSNCPVRIVQSSSAKPDDTDPEQIQAHIAAVFFPKSEFPIAKSYWQHTGEGVSSRLAEYFLDRLPSNLVLNVNHNNQNNNNNKSDRELSYHHHKVSPPPPPQQQPKASEKLDLSDGAEEEREQSEYLEGRFGRNMDLSFGQEAKTILKRRIAGKLVEDSNSQLGTEREDISEDDVYLYSTGMASIFNAHRLLRVARGDDKKSVCFGFPYTDTLKVLQKWGAGAYFLGGGEDKELVELEQLLESGEKILAVFTEFPSNPLLKSSNLIKIRELADKYDFAVVVDETVGNFLNVHVLPYTDVVVSSLTKVFSGDSNVMAGSLVLNPKSKYYSSLKQTMATEYEDCFWVEDAIFLERNSRDFEERTKKINVNAEASVELFMKSALIKNVYYPKVVPSRKEYEMCKTPSGGYGGLLSILFKEPKDNQVFFDAVNIAKGPSLGTNFTLTCPYTLIAHYQEFDFVEKYGVDRNLIRISVGLEDTATLLDIFKKGLEAVEKSHESGSKTDAAV